MHERLKSAITVLDNTARKMAVVPIACYEWNLVGKGIIPHTSREVRHAIRQRGLGAGVVVFQDALHERADVQVANIEQVLGKNLSSKSRIALRATINAAFGPLAIIESGVRMISGEKGERVLGSIYKNTPLVDWIWGETGVPGKNGKKGKHSSNTAPSSRPSETPPSNN